MKNCACQSGKKSSECCEPFLKNLKKPTTAEELMRSRYTAFSTGQLDYIEATHDPKTIKGFDRASTEKWATESEWQGLEIVRTEDGGPNDTRGLVEFKAKFRFQDQDQVHHELSEFRKANGVWYFVDGKLVQKPVVHEEPKTGRNDPCPCGSGKKYKKCCGAQA